MRNEIMHQILNARKQAMMAGIRPELLAISLLDCRRLFRWFKYAGLLSADHLSLRISKRSDFREFMEDIKNSYITIFGMTVSIMKFLKEPVALVGELDFSI